VKLYLHSPDISMVYNCTFTFSFIFIDIPFIDKVRLRAFIKDPLLKELGDYST